MKNSTKIFTNLTIIFAILALVEISIGLYTENYMSNYKGSFFADQLPYVFVGTIILSFFSNLLIVILEYFKNENTK
jgi:hypothetical protein